MYGASGQQFYHPAVGGGQVSGINFKPVGVFWDIENCSLPRGKTASSVIHFIRNFFVVNRLNNREYEFLIACDITRLRKDIPEDINRAGGVTLAHVSSMSKNAADEKLRESMKRFVDTHASLAPILILISGDIDFVNDLRGFQTRLGCAIIVLHGPTSSPYFKQGWNESKRLAERKAWVAIAMWRIVVGLEFRCGGLLARLWRPARPPDLKMLKSITNISYALRLRHEISAEETTLLAPKSLEGS